MNARYDVWTDPDLGELVRSEPELAAVADALAQGNANAAASEGRRRLLRPTRLAALAAALAAAMAVALIAPWEHGGGSLSERALAAVGSQPVLHVIADSPIGGQLIDLKTGETQPEVMQQEIWYDADRGLKRTVTKVGRATTGITLETPQGGFTPAGIVYDCAWIAAHPGEATKAGVSCNPSGDNGSTPRDVPRPKPTLEPGLTGFVDGYQQALASGQARDGGPGEIAGQPVDWLVFPASTGSTRVALDQKTHKPILLESNPGQRLRIQTIETIAYDATDFARPKPDDIPAGPSRGRTTREQPLPLTTAAIDAALPGAIWAGSTVGGLPLVSADKESLKATYHRDSRPAQTGAGIELVYGTLKAGNRIDRSQPYVEISTAPNAVLAFANMWGFVRGDTPPEGHLYLATQPTAGWQIGFTIKNGAYVTVQASSRDLLLQAARSLQPLTP